MNILQVDLGLKTENVITFGVSPELNGYTPEKSRVFFERLETDLAGVPGVKNVSASLVPLISGSNWGNDVKIDGAKVERRLQFAHERSGSGLLRQDRAFR